MASLLHAVVRMMVPLLLLAQGGTWTLQTGILNIGQEGALLLSAFFAVLGNHFFGSWIMGILFAIGVAVLYNLLFGLFCVTLRANIWVVGMTLNIMADAGAILLMKSIFGVKGGFRSDRMVPIPNAEFSFLPDWLVPWCNGYSLVVWITLLFFCLCWYVDSKTVFGMRLKAAGENEEALEAAGIRVSRLRYATLLVNSFAVGLGGAFLSTSYLFGFTQGMSAGGGGDFRRRLHGMDVGGGAYLQPRPGGGQPAPGLGSAELLRSYASLYFGNSLPGGAAVDEKKSVKTQKCTEEKLAGLQYTLV